MSTIVVTLLPVGQGAMNLIEIYEGEPNHSPLKHLTLIDCGIDRTRPISYKSLEKHAKDEKESAEYVAAKESVDYVVDRMNERIKQEPHFYLDYVLFTHRDSDHWTLFNAIWEKAFCSVVTSDKKYAACIFHNDIDDNVSEFFLRNMGTDFSSYTRTYSSEDENGDLFVEYRKTLETEPVERLLFSNTKQTYAGFILSHFPKEEYSCVIYLYKHNFISCIMAHPEPCESDKNTLVIHTVFRGSGEPRIKTRDILCNTQTKDSLGLWSAWKIFIEELSKNELKDYKQHLDHIVTFLEDGISKGGFLHYTQKDIINKTSEKGALTSPIGKILWGGNEFVDWKKNGDARGVGILRKQSEYLAKDGAVEVSSTDRECNRFHLLNNIYLDILARIPNNQFKKIELDDAESADNPAILNNGTSAVALLSVGEKNNLKFLFTGDATIHTFFHMQTKGKLKNANKAIWTAPHHGSYTTAKGVDKNTRIDFPSILSCSEPKGMVIESGQNNKHGHPNITFFRWVEDFFAEKKLECTPHFVYVNLNDTRDANLDTRYTQYPIYSGISAKKNPDNRPTLDDPDNLRNPVIIYKTHQFIAAETEEEYAHEEDIVATGGVFRTTSKRRPGQPAPPPHDVELPPPPSNLFFRRK